MPLDGSEESLTLLCMASQHRQGDVSIEMRCVCAIALFYKRLASQRQSGQEVTVALRSLMLSPKDGRWQLPQGQAGRYGANR